MTAVIAIDGLRHVYLEGTPQAQQALYNASLHVAPADVTAVIGPIGAGKSTLLHFCNGLLRPRERGRVMVLDQDLSTDVDLAALRRNVGLVFQYPHHQLFERFVGDDVAYGPRQMGLDEDEVEERVQWALQAVALDPEVFADRPTLSLSGGEMRRAAIAGVLATRPSVLILDEVTTGLDPEGREQIHALLRQLNEREGTAVLFVSNDLDEVATLAHKAMLLYRGYTLAEGSVRELFADLPLLARAELGAPFAGGLAAALEARGIALEHMPLTAAEAEEELWQAWKG